MKEKRSYSKIMWLYITYFGALVLCLVLSFTSKQSAVSVVINAALFLIVGIIFFKATKSLKRIRLITRNLNDVSAKIEEEYNVTNVYLWNAYKSYEAKQFFFCGDLVDAYDSFVAERLRLEKSGKGVANCRIDNYINKEFVDVIVKKNLYNLVPGTMTGLGILGTFLGLSFGLQQFNTGSAAEISNSIAPLMDGIKVAFHTSVYGMVFSLVFNLIYKQTLEDAYSAVDNYLEVFEQCVLSDPENDYVNSIQNTIMELPEQIGTSIGGQLANLLTPVFDEIKETMTKFASNVTENQMAGMSELVDSFVAELNSSMGNNFEHLGEVIEQTCELQKQNSDFMMNILSKVSDMTSNIQQINEMSEQTIKGLAGYIDDVEKLQSVINDSYMSVNIQLEAQAEMNEKMNGYITTLVNYEKQISDTSSQFTKDIATQIERLNRLENEISVNVKNNLAILAQKAQEYGESIAKAAKQQIQEVLSLSQNTSVDMNKAAQELSVASNNFNKQLANALNSTFDSFDSNLTEITKHLSGTISEVDNTMNRVPKLVNAAYDGMDKSFQELQTKLDVLVHSLDIMQRNMPRLVDKLTKEQ